MKRLKIGAIMIAKALLSAVLVLLVLRKVHVIEVAARVQNIGWFFPAAALTCFVAILFLAARRWQVLSGGLLSYPRALKYTWIGIFYGAILPGVVSGDVAKGASLALKNKDARVAELPLSIAMDKAIGLYVLVGFFVFSCATLAFGTELLSPYLKRLGVYGFIAGAVALSLGACGAGLVGKVLVRRNAGLRSPNRTKRLLEQVFDTLQLYRTRPRLLLQAMGYSTVMHCMGVMSFYLTIRALHVDCHMMEVVVFYSMIAVLISLPVTISGLGLRDWFSLTFFQSLWGDGQAGVAFAWLALAFTLIVAIAGGIVQITDLFTWRETRRNSDTDSLEGEAVK